MGSDIAKLNSRHHKIMDFCIAGLTEGEIAKRLEMSDRQIRNILKSPSFQHMLAVRRDAFEKDFDEKIAEVDSEVAELLRKHSLEAAKTLGHGLKSMNESVAFRSAEAILDRTGHPRTSRQLSDARTVVQIDKEDLELMKETLELEECGRRENS